MILILFVVLAACTSVAPTQPTGTVTDIAARLDSALNSRSRDAFVGQFGLAAKDLGLSWYAVLTAGGGSISGTGEGQLRVTYRLAGDRTEAQQELRYRLAEGTDQIEAVTAEGTILPIWALPGIGVTATRSGTLISASQDAESGNRWAERIDRASRIVAEEGVGVDWAGGIVVEVPPEGRFEQVTGAPAAETSAITICSEGTPRVVINPALVSRGEEWLDSTLVHEAVHVATNSACATPGTSLDWAVEGLAESVAARSDVSTARRNRELVTAYLKDHGLPDALPQQPGTLTDYALTQVAVEAVRDHLGAEAISFLHRATNQAKGISEAEIRQATRWYQDALRHW